MHTLDSTASNLIMNKVLERCAWCHTGLEGKCWSECRKRRLQSKNTSEQWRASFV